MSTPAATVSRASPFAGRGGAGPAWVASLPAGPVPPRLGAPARRPPATRLPAAVSVALHLLAAAALLAGVPPQAPDVPAALVVELMLPATPEPEPTAPEPPAIPAEAAPSPQVPVVAAEPSPPDPTPAMAEPPRPDPPTALAEPAPPDPPLAIAEAAQPAPPAAIPEAPPPPEQPSAIADFSPPPAAPEAARPAPAPSRPAVAKPRPAQPRPSAPRPASAAAHDAPAPAAPSASPAAEPARPAATPSPSYVALLLAALERHKVYPEEARWRRAQGVALLRFRMRRDGVVVGFRVERTSGDDGLDGAVLGMVQRASPLPPPPPDLAGDTIELTVPVRFTLR